MEEEEEEAATPCLRVHVRMWCSGGLFQGYDEKEGEGGEGDLLRFRGKKALFPLANYPPISFYLQEPPGYNCCYGSRPVPPPPTRLASLPPALRIASYLANFLCLFPSPLGGKKRFEGCTNWHTRTHGEE